MRGPFKESPIKNWVGSKKKSRGKKVKKKEVGGRK